MRRRSDSTNTAPPELRPALLTESEDEIAGEFEKEFLTSAETNGSGNGSYPTNGNNDFTTGPVIPAILLQGTAMAKVSKKKKKLLTLTLDTDAAKVSWDKNKPSKCFYIDDIKEIRAASDSRNYIAEFEVRPHEERRFFSILYACPDKSKEKAQKMIHLIAGDDRTYELWTSTLDAISKHRHELMASLSSFNEKAVKAYWRREMNKIWGDIPHSEDDEVINMAGVERLCRSLHIHGVYNRLISIFNEADISKTGTLSFAEFQGFINLMKRREDLKHLFEKLVSPTRQGLTLDEFLGFLRDVQGEDVDNNRAHYEAVFARFVRRSKTKEQAQQDQSNGEELLMVESALASYLTSTYNVPVKPTPASYSLDRPLNEYFISSSHNTYLVGRQVAGQSSVEAYISALCKGCRCVEVDCWDGNDGYPVVMHGRTLTSQVSFQDVFSTISKYAFVKSHFPLVISLEVHCSAPQQAIMADIIRQTCGSKLVTEPLNPESQQLPSPSELMDRILIKVKMPRDEEAPTPEPSITRRRGASINTPYTRPSVADMHVGSAPTKMYSPPISPRQRATIMPSRNQPTRMKLPSADNLDGLVSSTSESESMPEEIVNPKKQSNIVKVLGELGVYAAGVKFAGFDADESKMYNHIYSFMESTFAKNSKTTELKRMVVRHNMRYMMRVYPNGWRFTSSNFDPLMYWCRGVQMCALNWQTWDLGMQLNDAMFAAGTDVSGYVLKPNSLREITMLQNVPAAAGAGHIKRERKIVSFSINVISAQQLMRPRNLPSNRSVDPYVEVEVYHADDKTKEQKGVSAAGGHNDTGSNGSSGLGTPRRLRTQIVQQNGFNPVFDKRFKFDLVTKYPELVFVRFTVRASRDGHSYDDVKSPPLAIYTAKLSSLKQGYRTLPLMDNNGDQFLFSTLFCKFNIKPVTSVYVDKPAESVNKLKHIGRSILARAGQVNANLPHNSPKTSSENIHSSGS